MIHTHPARGSKRGGAAAMAAMLLRLSSPHSAHAGILLGFYAGGAVGQARVEAGTSGLLGHPRWSSSTGLPGFISADVPTKGVAAYGMLYLPIPLPTLDVYVKAGANPSLLICRGPAPSA